MFEYRMVMSIHDQKMQEYRAQAERARMARNAGKRPFVHVFRVIARRVGAAGRALRPSQPTIARHA